MNLVTDCSFIMSSILPDENQAYVEDIYNDIANNTYKVYVPSIFYLECNNVLLSALKRKRITQKSYEEYIELLSVLPIHVDNFCGTPESLYAIGSLAIKYELSSYDASYLEVAIRMNASMATLDTKLASKCNDLNVRLVFNS